MTTRISFTPATLDALTVGQLKDPTTVGLSIDVTRGARKRWRYRRRLAGCRVKIELTGGFFPAVSIGDARAWARQLNEQVERGIDPREMARQEKKLSEMTVARAHGLYMEAVREGRATRAKRVNKPRTIDDKLMVYRVDIEPKLANSIIYDVAEADLVKLVRDKGKVAKIRANRLIAELKTFFGWAASLRGMEIGLESDPSRRLGDLRFPETRRSRTLSLEEVGWLLSALVPETRVVQRAFLIMLLSAARRNEVVLACTAEVVDGVWTIPAERAKNSIAHRIELGPWGRAMLSINSEWIFPAERLDGPKRYGWYKVVDRLHTRMETSAGRAIPRFCLHDLRRTARSNTKRLGIDYETAEAMLNHVKKGMERTYDAYALKLETRAWFKVWEGEIIRIAREVGAADALGAPVPKTAAPRRRSTLTKARANPARSARRTA